MLPLRKRKLQSVTASAGGLCQRHTPQLPENKDEISLPPGRQTSAYLSVKYSYAPWIVKMWLEEYGSKFTEDLLAAGNKTPEVAIRPNLLKISRRELKRSLEEKGYEVHDGRMSNIALRVKGEDLLDTSLYNNGMFSVQDESSMAVVDC